MKDHDTSLDYNYCWLRPLSHNCVPFYFKLLRAFNVTDNQYYVLLAVGELLHDKHFSSVQYVYCVQFAWH